MSIVWKPLLIGTLVGFTSGGDKMPKSTSYRAPKFTVSRGLADQVSPNQTAYVGRGMSKLQFPQPVESGQLPVSPPPYCAKARVNRSAIESRPLRSHFEGSFQAVSGMRRSISAGRLLNAYVPRPAFSHQPVSR